MSKPALGRGLGALLGGSPALTKPASSTGAAGTTNSPIVLAPAPESAENRELVRKIPLAQVRPCPLQPRKDFPPETLRELADSIREQGIVQPIIVRPRGDHFELIAGERRLRAAQLIGLTEVPVIVRQADDRAVLEMALIENLQRENLNPIEEALGYSQLVNQFQLTQEEVATKVGKSRTAVANAVRLLKLPSKVQSYIREDRLTVGHAKVILGLTDERQQLQAAERVIKEALNVRQTEGLVAKLQSRPARAAVPATSRAKPVDANIARIEDRLRERLGTKTKLHYQQGKGAIEISFYSDNDLERILELLGVPS